MKTWRRMMLVGMALVLFCEMALAVNVRGPISCDSWLQDREKEKQSPVGVIAWIENSISQNWLVGYLSGLAVATNNELWGQIPNANSLDNETVFLWMDNYCRGNTRKDLAFGAIEFFRERTPNK